MTQIAEDFQELRAIEEANKEKLQDISKLLQVVAQLLKNQSYSNEFEKINSVIVLDEKIK